MSDENEIQPAAPVPGPIVTAVIPAPETRRPAIAHEGGGFGSPDAHKSLEDEEPA